ncbi:hypothetical protein N7532_001254 [Penicillium argentinense]|uniref:Protein HGH1 homolog n=1 Tax=Penicillium argentinense TaxID=1131581 RepID=A0A9W9G249_9EURO|nr:uncharacterized protein N7532_001254 [Penicillium argentinense]KAJ5110719.1 hypothetical protein N7532_001254 [Penicillium argentinense]
MPTELEELVEFLHHGNTQIRQIACENLVGFSTAQPSLFKRQQLLPVRDLKLLARDYTPIAKNALTILINLSSDEEVLKNLAEDDDFIETLLFKLTSIKEPNADEFATLLANLAKSDALQKLLSVKRRVPEGVGGLNKNANFDYLSYFFADLSQTEKGRSYFTTRQEYDSVVPITKLTVFTEHKSDIRRKGVASTIKNVAFDVPSHPMLFDEDAANLLPYLLLPITGPEEYPDDEMMSMHPDLQLLGPDKRRDSDNTIITTHLETLLLLTTTREGRNLMREVKVYPVIRECHLHVNDEGVKEACDRLVQVLMRDEEGEGQQTEASLAKAQAQLEAPPAADEDQQSTRKRTLVSWHLLRFLVIITDIPLQTRRRSPPGERPHEVGNRDDGNCDGGDLDNLPNDGCGDSHSDVNSPHRSLAQRLGTFMSRAPLIRSSRALGSSSYGAVRIPQDPDSEGEASSAVIRANGHKGARGSGSGFQSQTERTSSESCTEGPSDNGQRQPETRRSHSSGRRRSSGWHRREGRNRNRRPSSATSDVGMGADSKYSFATGLAVPGNPVMQETPASSPYITSDEEDSLDLDGEDTKSSEEDPPDNSPYAQVRAIVPATDNISLSINTPRMWILSLLFSLSGSAANLFFSLRYPSVAITPIIALVLVHPLGKFWDALLKRTGDPLEVFENGTLHHRELLSGEIDAPEINWLSRMRLWLGQGRWNEKEHACVYISSNVSFGFAFATDVIVEQHKFYQQEVPIMYQLLLIISTQVLGYAFAGLTRRFLVRPSAMIWPGTLMSTAMFSTMHKTANKKANGWSISRYKFFIVVWGAAFLWYFIPGLLMPALSYFNVITWFAPKNVVVSNLFGVASGLGMFPLTFDWAQIAYIGSPLLTPWWAAANIVTGLVIVIWAIAPIMYYKNVLFTSYMPILSAAVFDNTGHPYNVSRILTSDFLFDKKAYDEYSPVYLPITYVLSYGVQFAALTSLVTHTVCWYGKDIWQQTRKAFEERRELPGMETYQPLQTDQRRSSTHHSQEASGDSSRDTNREMPLGMEDVHCRLMRRYEDAPLTWYLIVLITMLAIAIYTVEHYPVHLPWYGLLLALGVTSVFFIPVGIIMAVTNQHSSLYLICQLLCGIVFPGRPVANMIFVTYSYISSAQGIKFSSDLKLGHYMKIPPRLLFGVQMMATLVSSLTQIGVLNWMFTHIPMLCTPLAMNGFNCPIARVHFNGSILWGVVGPQRFFGPGGLYRPLVWTFLIGAVAPLGAWALGRRSKKNFWRKVNFPILFGSLSWIPPATGLNFSIWALVCFVFNYVIRRRKTAWWEKYAMTLSAALDSGLAFAVIVVFFAFIYPGFVDGFKWWGTEIYKQLRRRQARMTKLVADLTSTGASPHSSPLPPRSLQQCHLFGSIPLSLDPRILRSWFRADMSTPVNPSNGRKPTSPNGPPPMRIRRPRPADPLVRPKRKPKPAGTAPGGAAPGGSTASKTLPTHPAASNVPPQSQPDRNRLPVKDDHAVNGFSGSLLSETYVDYPVVTTKRALREGIKHHIARFAAKRSVDPRDESQFTRPVRLHRRDPRTRTNETNPERLVGPDGQQLTEADREALDARRAAREKERAENLAQIAPSVGSSAKRPNAPKQKTQQVYKSDYTPEEIAKARVRYEEALPWHLEDFDNRNIWVGNYEAALSETHAVFFFDNGKVRMIPAEKWYKFTAKSHFKALTIEEAEKHMSKRIKDPRWFMEKQAEMKEQKELEQYAKSRKVFAGKQGVSGGREGLGAGEMDFEEDRFADDEEHYDDLFTEQDEDAKEAEKRIKEDQLKANVFDLKDEKDYEDEEKREKWEKEARHVQGKKMRKALKKREKNYDYSSGSDANPYTDEESSDDSEAERAKEEEKKNAEEEKNQKDSVSSKGTNTPSGRPKHTDALKKSAASRKRLGSPTGSDASGTDTSRKKAKNKHQSSHPTPQPTSRPISPSQAGKKRVRNIPLGGSGSGSDVEVAGSGGEMSESGKTKKLKLNPPGTSRGGTPQGSRAGSPEGGMKGRMSTPIPAGNQPFPTPAEIHAAIPATGILSTDLLRIFRPRIGDSKENHRRFIAIVKDVSVYGKEDRMLRPGPWKDA